jgi:hypothetical protein
VTKTSNDMADRLLGIIAREGYLEPRVYYTSGRPPVLMVTTDEGLVFTVVIYGPSTVGEAPETDLSELPPLAVDDRPQLMTDSQATECARKIWPEAEGFERIPGGWTFRVGAGYSAITDSGRVGIDPQGARRDAQRFMPGCGSSTTGSSS